MIYHQPSGRYSSEDRMEPYGETDKKCGKDVTKKEVPPYTTTAETPNLENAVENARCGHDGPMNKDDIIEAEVGNTSPRDSHPMTTVNKDGPRIAEDPDILIDKKVKVGCTISNRIRPNSFQPVGRALSRARTNHGTSNYKETTSGLANKIHMRAAARECALDSGMKEGIEIHKMTLPELVESGDETMPFSESDQEYRKGRADHWSRETVDISEKM